eukprot:gene24194-biopygen2890
MEGGAGPRTAQCFFGKCSPQAMVWCCSLLLIFKVVPVTGTPPPPSPIPQHRPGPSGYLSQNNMLHQTSVDSFPPTGRSELRTVPPDTCRNARLPMLPSVSFARPQRARNGRTRGMT